MERVEAILVTDRVLGLLRRLVRSGSRHLGRPVLAELAALEKSAHTARLVHLERDLAALGTEVGRCLDRSPQFRPEALVAAENRVHLHARAAREVLAGPPSPRDAEVLGVLRRTYEPVVGRVRVQVVAATGFVTDAGFTGITVHLASAHGGGPAALQATIVRPSDGFGDDPKRLLFQPVSDVTPLTVHELAHGAWWLDDVRVSADGRLSLHAGLQAVPAPPMPAEALAPIRVASFAEGVERLTTSELDPLVAAPGVRVFVEGLIVGSVAADDTRGTARVGFTDASGATAAMTVPLVPRHDLLLDNLSRLADLRPAALVGRLSAGPSGLSFEPWTAWFDHPVKLAFRRAGTVSEVHLALEPLPGEVRRGAPGPALDVEPPAPDAVEQAISAARSLLVELYATGTAHPEALGEDLGVAADRLGDVGATAAAGAVAAVGRALAGDGDTIEALQRASTHLRLLHRGVVLARLGAPAGAPRHVPGASRRGADRRLMPLGLVRTGGRVELHALDPSDGARFVVSDTWTASPQGVVSRLFHDVIEPRDVLSRWLEFRDHPVVRSREGGSLGPAWHTHPTLGDPIDPTVVPIVDAPLRGAPFRLAVEAVRGPDGWVLRSGGRALRVDLDEAFETDFEKRPSPVRFVGLFLTVGGGLRLLRADGACPPVDPAATRWRWGDAVARAEGTPHAPLIAALGSGAWPDVPDDPVVTVARGLPGDEARRHVAAHVAQLRKNVAGGEPLPSARILWSWGRFTGGGPPIATLGLPVERVRRAIVCPLARWLAGAEDPDVTEALWLLAGTGERSLHFERGPDVDGR